MQNPFFFCFCAHYFAICPCLVRSNSKMCFNFHHLLLNSGNVLLLYFKQICKWFTKQFMSLTVSIQGAIFFEIGGHEVSKVNDQYLTLLFDDENFYDPLWSYNVEKTCNPNVHCTENMHSWAFSLNKIFSQICGHPIIFWLFL